jgi:hypothetical protein
LGEGHDLAFLAHPCVVQGYLRAGVRELGIGVGRDEQEGLRSEAPGAHAADLGQ